MAKTDRKHRSTEQDPGNVAVEDAPDIDDIMDSTEESGQEPPPEARTAPEPAAPSVLTVPRAAELPADEFFAFCAQYPAPSDLDMYVYRLWPKIHIIAPPGFATGKKVPKYVEKLKGLVTPQTNRMVDLEWLRMVRGSGKYQICLASRIPSRTRTYEICRTFVEINEYDMHRPILNDWNELIPCEENKWFIERMLRDNVITRTPEGKFVPYQQDSHNGSGNTPVATDPAMQLRETVNLAKDLAKTMTPAQPPAAFTGADIVNLIGKTQQSNDPEKILSAARSLVEMTKPAAPAEDKNGSAILTLMLAQLEQQRQEAVEHRKEAAASREREFKLFTDLLAKANTPAAVATVDPIAAIKAQAESYVVLKDAFGGGEAAASQSRMNGWQEFLREPLVEFFGLLKPFAQVGAAAFASNIAAKQQQAQQQQQRPPAQPGAPPAPAAQPPAPIQQPANPPAQQQQQPPQEPQPPMDPTFMILNAAISHVDFTLRDHFVNDLSGAEFAEWFCNTAIPLPPPYNMMQDSVLGIEALKRIQSMTGNDPEGNTIPAPAFGKAIILAAYKSNPTVWQKLSDKEEKFSKFLDEFLAYNPTEEQP